MATPRNPKTLWRLGFGGLAAHADRIGGAHRSSAGRGMATPSGSGEGATGEMLSPRTARACLEEQLGKLDISQEEATPLVLGDCIEGAPEKWMVAGKILHRNKLHINTISNALRPAWGNPKGLSFRIAGEICL